MYKEVLATNNYRVFQTVEDNDEDQPQQIFLIHILEIGFEDQYIVNQFEPVTADVKTVILSKEGLSKLYCIDLDIHNIPVKLGQRKSDEESAVNHPSHYGGRDNPYEAIKVIKAWNLPFTTGNSVKYIARAGKKDPSKLIEDLEKAAWYLNEEIETQKNK